MCDIMKALVLIALILVALATPAFSDVANMTFESKSFNVVGGGNSPYFYGVATNNTSVMFFMPGKGQQRDTLFWLNKIPLNETVQVTFDSYVISDVKLNISGNWT